MDYRLYPEFRESLHQGRRRSVILPWDLVTPREQPLLWEIRYEWSSGEKQVEHTVDLEDAELARMAVIEAEAQDPDALLENLEVEPEESGEFSHWLTKAQIASPLRQRLEKLNIDHIAWLTGHVIGLILRELGYTVDPPLLGAAAVNMELSDHVPLRRYDDPGLPRAYPAIVPQETLAAIYPALSEIVETYSEEFGSNITLTTAIQLFEEAAFILTSLSGASAGWVPRWQATVHLDYEEDYDWEEEDSAPPDEYPMGIVVAPTPESARERALDRFHDEWGIEDVDAARIDVYVDPLEASDEAAFHPFNMAIWQSRWVDWVERHVAVRDPGAFPKR